ncbi:cytochrome-c peroxidase [Leptospira ryugenii]|uniref:Cytochrome-c peroxidase n=1 Tax=Leptospira ryugenii TaxID=1917863 RepID=A0A2P2E472_9LEPT|nr:MbnH family di-heme enzyme [Leptospira ryugenii]GBF51672.1 cytochrome-c peroxidase [Leptospira ryugenii]
MKLQSIIAIFLLISCSIFEKKKNDNDLVLGLILLSANNAYKWNLPPGFPVPTVPSENPMSEAKVALGRHLFYDKNLSQDRSLSCSGCHKQSLAFTDGRRFGIGITNEAHPRNSQNLGNAAYHPRLTWANPQMTTLEIQSRVPMFGESPIELGLINNDYLDRLKADTRYISLFNNAFGGAPGSISEQNVRFALASFQRSLITGNAPADKYAFQNQSNALNASQIRGFRIFNGEVAECFHCHGGFNYTDTVFHNQQPTSDIFYHNNGIYTKAEYDALSVNKRGLYEITLLESDQGKFRAPSLRNIGLTFPYMHDGSFMCDDSENPSITSGKTIRDCAVNALRKVVAHYESGGKSHPNKDSSFIRPFTLTAQERTDLVEFLLSLTDTDFINNPAHSNPF